MAETAAHLVEQVIPWVPTRQWVVSVPIPLRYWMAASTGLMAQVHTIIRRTINQYYINHAVQLGHQRQQVQAGSVTFVQRFGSALQLNLHYHMILLEGVYLDRSAQGLKPKFVKIAPPSDADIAAVIATISQRVIRKLRQLGYLESGLDAPVATGHDPLVDEEPELAHTLAASVQQRIAFGERAGRKVRRIGSGFGSEGESPLLTGTRCASVHGFSLHANTYIAAHRRDQVERLIRYTARGAVSLERLEQDVNGELLYTFTRAWSDGPTGIKLSPLDLLEKLAALVPPPRVHQVVSRIDLEVWGLFSRAQHAARRHHADATPARPREGRPPRRGALGVGAAAHTRLSHRYGTLSPVSPGRLAPHCRHHVSTRHPS